METYKLKQWINVRNSKLRSSLVFHAEPKIFIKINNITLQMALISRFVSLNIILHVL